MDYGQTTQTKHSEPEQPFFTAGVGAESANLNTFESENNLDLTNAQTSWNSREASNLRGLGNNAINSIDKNHPEPIKTSGEKENAREFIPNPNSSPESAHFPSAPQLGEIESTMPPGYTDVKGQGLDEKPATPILFNQETMMDGDKLSKQAIEILQREEKELTDTGDIATFVDKIDNYREQFQGGRTTWKDNLIT